MVWGSMHVFILPYIEQGNLWKSLAIAGTPTNYDPTTRGGPANTIAVPSYVCPDDPSVKDGIVEGGTLGAASYAANAQLFAPLTDETIKGGAMSPAHVANFTDRGSTIVRIQDGSSNTIMVMHVYGLCGGKTQGSAWGYGAGVGKAGCAKHVSALGACFLSEANLPDGQGRSTVSDAAESLCHEVHDHRPGDASCRWDVRVPCGRQCS